MHPAFSVMFFTVTSGLGYGLLMVFALWYILGLAEFSENLILIIGGKSLVLITLGLISSSFHLANPKNAWRAFNRFRTSWLSREGVFAVMLYPFAMAFLFLAWQGEMVMLAKTFAWITIIIAFLTVFSTGMIYACLKTIRQWNTPLVPTNYLLFSFVTGSLTLLAVIGFINKEIPSSLLAAAIFFILISAVVKLIYYFWIGRPDGPTINTATGFTLASMRILDQGHTAGTFLNQEFSYQVSSQKVMLLRIAAITLTFILPLAILIQAQMATQASYILLSIAAILAYVGLMVERWLFFAEAKHVVNLYHGMQRT